MTPAPVQPFSNATQDQRVYPSNPVAPQASLAGVLTAERASVAAGLLLLPVVLWLFGMPEAEPPRVARPRADRSRHRSAELLPTTERPGFARTSSIATAACELIKHGPDFR